MKRLTIGFLFILTTLSITACQSDYDKKMGDIRHEANKLNEGLVFSGKLPGVEEVQNNIQSVEELNPNIFNQDRAENKTTNVPPSIQEVQNQVENSEEDKFEKKVEEDSAGVEFTGNNSVSTYPQEIAVVYNEVQNEQVSMLKVMDEYKNSKRDDEMKEKSTNLLLILLNSSQAKQKMFFDMSIPTDYEKTYSKFTEQMNKTLAIQVNLNQSYLSYIKTEDKKTSDEIQTLKTNLSKENTELMSIYRQIY